MTIDSPRVLLIPTYNEQSNVRKLVTCIHEVDPELDILIIDDNSTDGTAETVAELMKNSSRLFLLNRLAKEGLGVAYAAGFAWALAKDYQLIAQMDGDLSHDPKDLPRLFNELLHYDVVVGSRYVEEGAIEKWNHRRRLLSSAGNTFARLVVGVPLNDLTSGFRAFRRNVPEQVFNEPLIAKGYGFQIEVLAKAYRAGFSLTEVPICFRERHYGESKMHFGIVTEALRIVFQLRRHH